MFNKSKKTVSAPITINGVTAIKNYTPDLANGRCYVSQVEDLTVILGMNPKDCRGVKRMIATATINDPDLSLKFGDHVIIVDKAFMKLPNKQQLILINIENEKLLGVDSRYTINTTDGIDIDNVLIDASAKINTMEEFGVRKVNRAIAKKTKFSLKSEDRMGRYMHKAATKNAKPVAPADSKVKRIIKNPIIKNPFDAFKGKNKAAAAEVH